MPPPLTQTPCVWVHTPKQLQQMLQELQGVACIALDTEHNSQRSYLGMLCLLQLSTGMDRNLLCSWHAFLWGGYCGDVCTLFVSDATWECCASCSCQQARGPIW
jgi:hypothetical protein